MPPCRGEGMTGTHHTGCPPRRQLGTWRRPSSTWPPPHPRQRPGDQAGKEPPRPKRHHSPSAQLAGQPRPRARFTAPPHDLGAAHETPTEPTAVGAAIDNPAPFRNDRPGDAAEVRGQDEVPGRRPPAPNERYVLLNVASGCVVDAKHRQKEQRIAGSLGGSAGCRRHTPYLRSVVCRRYLALPAAMSSRLYDDSAGWWSCKEDPTSSSSIRAGAAE